MQIIQKNNPKLNGKSLPVMEEFYSIQGEGFNTGTAAYFIRIGGCDVCCEWCDIKESWNSDLFPLTDVDDIVLRVKTFPVKAVLITGGEPLLYKLDYLCDKLKKQNIKLFLETSGSHFLSGSWDWICLSAKKNSPPLEENFKRADELKVIIFDESDFEWAEKNANLVKSDCILYLQPEWSRSEKMMQVIVDYILE
ncbi:MAG: 7-carboxy-7-deazaguanine synthase QueE, partial [Bacteroidales bacterium]|nr:7-carboxy-7-deazaguanine synthase QueE [Bacteroidales bacterium]